MIKRKYFNFSAIVNFNFVYRYSKDIELLKRDLDVFYITLMKECVRTPIHSINLSMYRERIESYSGDLVLVHNNQTKDLLLKSGKFNCPVITAGQPRSDLLAGIRASKTYPKSKKYKLNKSILYFMVSDRAGLPYFSGQYNDLTDNFPKPTHWGDNINKVPLSVVFTFMKRNPNISLIIKGKLDLSYNSLVIPDSLKHRVKILHGNPDMSLYSTADLVMGFNSTCLVEAHLAGIPAVSLEFFDQFLLSASNYLLTLPSCIPRIRSIEFLEQHLYSLQENRLDQPALDMEFISSYLGNTHFTAGENSAKQILKLFG